MVGIQGENGLENFAGNPAADAQLDDTSTNAVQNKVVTENINEIKDELLLETVNLYNDSGKKLTISRYGKLRILLVQGVPASDTIHNLLSATDKFTDMLVRGTIICSGVNNDSNIVPGELSITGSTTQYLASNGTTMTVRTSGGNYYGQLSWLVP